METTPNFLYTTIDDITLTELKKRCTKIHYFGLGFIQIKLGDRHRLHVYTEALPPIVESDEIHDHRYNFYSTVLHGSFHQEIFKKVKGGEYTEEYENCMETKVEEPNENSTTMEKYNVIKIGEQWFSKGSSYYIDSNCFHRVSSEEAITLLSRSDYTKDRARVLRKNTGNKVCPFSKKISEEELWSIVEAMLNKAQLTK